MKKLLMLAVVATGLLAAACAQAAAPAPTPAPAPPTATPPPMANKLIVFGDTVLFLPAAQSPDSCTAKSRYKRGEPVGFRMMAIDPMTGKGVEGAELVVSVTYGNKTDKVEMRDRSTGNNPHPGMWTGKWVVPNDAPTGIVKFTVTAKDKAGRTGEWTPATSPLNVESSLLAVVD